MSNRKNRKTKTRKSRNKTSNRTNRKTKSGKRRTKNQDKIEFAREIARERPEKLNA